MKQRLSKVEASQELGVSISTIDRMIRRGDLQIEREGTKSNDRVWVILEVWPESHWPGFALRQTDVL